MYSSSIAILVLVCNRQLKHCIRKKAIQKQHKPRITEMGQRETKWGKDISVFSLSLRENASGSTKQSPKCSLSWNIQNIPLDLLHFKSPPFCMTKQKRCCLSWFADWSVSTSEWVNDKHAQTENVCTFTFRTKTDERQGNSLPLTAI